MKGARTMLHADIECDSRGYMITVVADGGRILWDYSVGGNPCDSYAPGCSHPSTVRGWAISALHEYFVKHLGRCARRDEYSITKRERE